MKHQKTIIADNPARILLLVLVILALVEALLTALIVSGSHKSTRIALPHPCERGNPVPPVRQDKCRPFSITFLS